MPSLPISHSSECPPCNPHLGWNSRSSLPAPCSCSHRPSASASACLDDERLQPWADLVTDLPYDIKRPVAWPSPCIQRPAPISPSTYLTCRSHHPLFSPPSSLLFVLPSEGIHPSAQVFHSSSFYTRRPHVLITVFGLRPPQPRPLSPGGYRHPIHPTGRKSLFTARFFQGSGGSLSTRAPQQREGPVHCPHV